MMKVLLPVTLLGILLCTACNSGESGNKSSSAGEKETVHQFKRIENLRFGFSAMIPEAWNAVDPSDNGDGFIISLPGDEKRDADIRMYGSYEPATASEIDKDTLEIFSFNDGTEGRAFTDGDTFQVQRILGKDRFVVFSVKQNRPGWISENQALLMKIAESLQPVNVK